jgi:DNA-binding beta-propeller fold protein YncE
MIKKSAGLAIGIAFLYSCVAAAYDELPLTLEKSIPLAVQGRVRFDHFAMDLSDQRVYLTAEEAHTIVAVDLVESKVVAVIGGFEKAHAICYQPSRSQFFVSDEDGTFKIVDKKSLQIIKTEHLTLNQADALRFDPGTEYLYIANQRKGSNDPNDKSFLAIVDTKLGTHVGDISVRGSHIEQIALEEHGERLFVGVVSRKEIGIVDRKKRIQVGAWRVPGLAAPYALALDETGHRLFVSVHKPDQLLILNSDTGELVSALPSPAGSDDIYYDAARKRVYVSAGVGNQTEGYITVYQQLYQDRYREMTRISTGSASATSLFVPELNRYYVAVQANQNKSPQLQVYKINPQN